MAPAAGLDSVRMKAASDDNNCMAADKIRTRLERYLAAVYLLGYSQTIRTGGRKVQKRRLKTMKMMAIAAALRAFLDASAIAVTISGEFQTFWTPEGRVTLT